MSITESVIRRHQILQSAALNSLKSLKLNIPRCGNIKTDFNMLMQSSIPVRDILRNYKAVFSKINKTGKGVIVIRNNEPEVAIIPISEYEKIQLEALKNEAIDEYRADKTKSIETEADWDKYEKEVLHDAL